MTNPRPSYQDRPPRINYYRDFMSFTLYTDAPSGGTKKSRLLPGMLNENFRFSCYPNDPTEAKDNPAMAKKGIIWGCNPRTFQRFINLFLEVAKGEKGKNNKIASNVPGQYEEGAARGPMILRSELYFGKDNEGIVWICVKAPDRPTVRFIFDASTYDVFYDPATGRPLNKDVNSQEEAISWAVLLSNIYGRSYPVEEPYQIVDGQRVGGAPGGSPTHSQAAAAPKEGTPQPAPPANPSFDDITW